MYAFLGHVSAIEVLRALSVEKDMPRLAERWPQEARPLPSSEHCIATQKQFRSSALDLEMLGISSSPVDLLVPSNSSCSRGSSARFHIWSRDIPAQAMVRLGESVFLSGPELTILQLCGSYSKLDPVLDANVAAYWGEKELMHGLGIEGNPAIDNPLRWENAARLIRAAALTCEFSGTYRLPARAGDDASYRLRPLMSCGSLRAIARSLRSTVVESRALRVADLAFDNSGSPMETALALILTLPVAWGGFGLPKPELNGEVDTSNQRGILADRDEVTPDLLWRKEGIAVEYDSTEKHGRAGVAQLSEDALRSNILTALGYRVLRVTPGVVATIGMIELLARQIAVLLGVELETPDGVQVLRRGKLFAELMPKRR